MWFPFAIGTVVCWALINVADSMLVRHFEHRPLVIAWNQSIFSMVFLAALPLFVAVAVPWPFLLLLLAGGVAGFLGDLLYWRALSRVDVSVTNLMLAILAVLLGLWGMLAYAEVWTLPQVAGASAVLGGLVVFTAKAPGGIPLQSVGLLVAIAAAFLPFYIIQEHALTSGIPVMATYFWLLLGRETMFIVAGLAVPSARRGIREGFARQPVTYYLSNAFVIGLFLGATFFSVLAYESGPASLVTVVGNVQPFLVIILAWAAGRILPNRAPKELFTAQSVRIKLFSFSIVFTGLALLALSQ